jgi:hypothetical protein
MNRLAVLCTVIVLSSCGKQSDKSEPAPDPATKMQDKAADTVNAGIDKATAAVDKAKDTVTASEDALTLEAYEKLVLGLAGCKLQGYSIDSKCDGAKALEDALKNTKTNMKDLLGFNAQLGQKLIGHTAPAVRVKAASLMSSVVGTAGASQDAIVAAAEKETDPGVLQAFIRTVSNDGAKNPKVGAMLMKTVEHADKEVRLQSVYALSSSWNRELAGGAEKLAAVAETDADAKVRQAACEYGGKLGNQAMLPVLEKLTAKSDDKDMYAACMEGLGAMFHQYPFYETKNEAAYKLFLKRLDATPRSEHAPPWGVMSLFRYAGDAKHEKLAEWKKQATWFKPADVKKALASVIADKKTNWMARTAAVESFAALGATKAEIEGLKKGYDGKDPNDTHVVKKIDETAAKNP